MSIHLRTDTSQIVSPRIREKSARLDLSLLTNPYAPSPAVRALLESQRSGSLPAEPVPDWIATRCANLLQTSPSSLVFADTVPELVSTLIGPKEVTAFVPGDLSALTGNLAIDLIARSFRFAIELGALEDRTFDAVYLQSPDSCLGNRIGLQPLIDLCQRSQLVILDERLAEFTTLTALPLTREFDNLVVIRSLGQWAGLGELGLAIGVAQPALLEALRDNPVSADRQTALLATLDDQPYLRASLSIVAREKSRLNRMLRKLNLVRPLPSWGPFHLVRVERGCRDQIVDGLQERGIDVWSPADEALARFFRIAAHSPAANSRLSRALRELSAEIS